MKNNELVEDLRAQNRDFLNTIKSLTQTVEKLTKELEALKTATLVKDKNIAKLKRLAEINEPKKSEKQHKSNSTKNKDKKKSKAKTPKERGNNGAKRKEYDNLEVVVEEVLPSDENFDEKASSYLFYRDVIRYEYIPPKLIKHIYRCKKFRMGDKLYEGKAPLTPFQNSQFESSFIAYLLQQRYIYSLPVERIINYLDEIGVKIPKSTVHGLIEKSAKLLDNLVPVLKKAVLESPYIHFDETYHTILDEEKGSRKGYFWNVLSAQSNLIQFFYDKGSRAKKVFTDYLPNTYKGAVQTDGYSSYKVLEGWEYPKAIRLACIQHCKRKFIEIENDSKAKKIVSLFNKLYQIRKKKPKEKWIENSIKVLEKLEIEFRKIEKDKKLLPDHKLRSATAYCLNELEAIYNTVESTEYDLDNNAIERPNRYISLSRRNSLFCGSDAGALRTATIYSLAISCRLNDINTYDYFKSIVQLLGENRNFSPEQLREIIPDRWKLKYSK
jgi:transposase-like protein